MQHSATCKKTFISVFWSGILSSRAYFNKVFMVTTIYLQPLFSSNNNNNTNCNNTCPSRSINHNSNSSHIRNISLGQKGGEQVPEMTRQPRPPIWAEKWSEDWEKNRKWKMPRQWPQQWPPWLQWRPLAAVNLTNFSLLQMQNQSKARYGLFSCFVNFKDFGLYVW